MNVDRNLAFLARVLKVLTWPWVRFEFHGGACARRLETGVIAANHRSMFDVVAGLIGLHHFGHYPRLLIEEKYVAGRWTAPLARAIGAIPVKRSEHKGQALAVAVDALRAGTSILVMPEGRLHVDAEDPTTVGRASTGVARMAMASGRPVVPAALYGSDQVWPGKRYLPRLNPFRRRRVVVVHVADDELVLPPDGDPREQTDRVMEAIRDLIRPHVPA